MPTGPKGASPREQLRQNVHPARPRLDAPLWSPGPCIAALPRIESLNDGEACVWPHGVPAFGGFLLELNGKDWRAEPLTPTDFVQTQQMSRWADCGLTARKLVCDVIKECLYFTRPPKM